MPLHETFPLRRQPRKPDSGLPPSRHEVAFAKAERALEDGVKESDFADL